MTSSFHAAAAWVDGGTASAVRIEVAGGRIASVSAGAEPEAGDRRLGWVVPGLVNAHSHAFHRALRGRAGGDDFWSWRDRMYAVADRLDPDSYRALAAAAYAEMALAGITAVGEFHYLHHRPGGRPYDDPAAMALALVEAADAAGVRLCLLDTCYLTAGIDGAPLQGAQVRFGDGDADGWHRRHAAVAEAVAPHRHVTLGAAIHSVRAVPPAALADVAAAAEGSPLHVHVSEQPAENDACLAATGMTPVELLADRGVLGPSTTAVHAVHVNEADVALLAESGTGVCACPSTEHDLGDGTVRGDVLAEAGIRLSLGSDSHAAVDILAEARTVEWNDRSRTGRRGIHAPAALWEMATRAGAAALGQPQWGLVPGAPADFVDVAADTVRTAGVPSIEGLVMSATAADVRTVVVGGEVVVEDGVHLRLPDTAPALAAAIESLDLS